ncbi:hypothetical protein [Desulfosporosinus sp. BICA1-9]|uniref:hypothetical protein n=1 Tax=Desulfosporosinus sp. BICA1-9 TaxID=1531958 RepID=UPI00054B2988|nr:hypothetical protein [Desulfosporosinus sp. BICA1-9]KJS50194.1 MAG: hypothetical protein VR66_04190 [Peptococcaceae bacterium BRH_c23]KJS89759.1 MAG: hypothetical protein JL57_05720 [Desulfosporosinus sp. BICA1-9]HBW38121.1 hypothetical protein [Desulfosporosinus sp.]
MHTALMAHSLWLLKYRMMGYPYANWACLAFLVFVLVIMYFNDDTRVALYIAPLWFGLLVTFSYAFNLHKNEDKLDENNLKEQLETGK